MSHYTTFEERLEIENGLRENLSFGEIAKRLGKDRSTISREVRKEAFAFFYGEMALQKLGCEAVLSNGVIITPKLLKR